MILAFLHEMPHVKGSTVCCHVRRRKPCPTCKRPMHWEPGADGILDSCDTCDPRWHEPTEDEIRIAGLGKQVEMGASREKKKK